MAIKEKNKSVLITLTPYHMMKLALLQKRTGLSRTGIIQRMIEAQDMFEFEKEDLTPPQKEAES